MDEEVPENPVSRVFSYRGRIVGLEFTPEASARLLAMPREKMLAILWRKE